MAQAIVKKKMAQPVKPITHLYKIRRGCEKNSFSETLLEIINYRFKIVELIKRKEVFFVFFLNCNNSATRFYCAVDMGCLCAWTS